MEQNEQIKKMLESLKPTNKYELVKIVFINIETNFDNGDITKTTCEYICPLDKVGDFNKVLVNLVDGEYDFKVCIVYDLYDNEPYSYKWLCGDLE